MKTLVKKILNFSIKGSIDYLKRKKRATTLQQGFERLSTAYITKTKQPKLQIGTGLNVLEGWLNTDLEPSSDKIAFLDASKRFPFKDNSFDFIFSEHIFEHLKFNESCNMISECLRVLKPNGVLRIAIPSAEFLFKIYENPELPIHKEYIKWATEAFCPDVTAVLDNEKNYSEIYVINNFYRDWGHEILHNYASLEKLLLKLKFSSVDRKEIGVSDFQEICNMEKHGTIIPERLNKLETIVVEAKKTVSN